MNSSHRAGRFVTQMPGSEGFAAFVPAPLPPDPPLRWESELQDLLEIANRGLGRLDGATLIAPNPDLFLYTYIRKEAVLSSQIEGTQSSLSDLLLFENAELPGIPVDDLREVSNYVAAMEHGLARLKGGFPLSLRLIREIHEILVRGSRGADKTPGEFRRSQNWIGGTRPSNAVYVPPAVPDVMPALDNLEKFLQDHSARTPVLIKAALGHAQFETIHPFLDGNGRVGRLLITFLLCAEQALREPLLYLSLYLKQNRSTYYDSLQRIRLEGEWENWLKFFLKGVADVSHQGVETMQRLLDLFARDRNRIQTALGGRRALTALRVHDVLTKRAVTSIPLAARATGLTPPTVSAAVEELEKLHIVREVTARQRNRQFLYSEYFRTLDEGVGPAGALARDERPGPAPGGAETQ
jgi:cell filamentation protein, protein adenylyltransferase